jgi:hypothetical protein
VRVDDALEALAAALRKLDVPRWSSPKSTGPIDELQATVSPMELPDELVAFWRQVDVTTLRVCPYPRFSTPEFALTSWQMAKSEFAALQPLALVQVGYESHDVMSVELDVGEVQGGALFEWFVSDPSGFTRRYNQLGDWLAYMAAIIDHGLSDRREGENGPSLLVPSPDREEQAEALRVTPYRHPVHGTEVHVGPDILTDWPKHWQRANGLRPEDLELRGATHTVAELLAGSPDDRSHATVAARVVDLMGSSGFTRVRVDDGTGTMDIHCPRETTLLGPTIRGWYEFDVVIPADSPQLPQNPEKIAAALDDRVAGLGATFMARYGGPVTASATAIRRMPPPE